MAAPFQTGPSYIFGSGLQVPIDVPTPSFTVSSPDRLAVVVWCAHDSMHHACLPADTRRFDRCSFVIDTSIIRCLSRHRVDQTPFEARLRVAPEPEARESARRLIEATVRYPLSSVSRSLADAPIEIDPRLGALTPHPGVSSRQVTTDCLRAEQHAFTLDVIVAGPDVVGAAWSALSRDFAETSAVPDFVLGGMTFGYAMYREPDGTHAILPGACQTFAVADPPAQDAGAQPRRGMSYRAGRSLAVASGSPRRHSAPQPRRSSGARRDR